MDNNLERLYREVSAHMESVDFSRLWNGFKPLKFALYNNDECFFDGEYIQKTDEFLGNTAISYNGEMIAIWNVMEKTDSVILTSKIIHEMFHGFQKANNESRFPDEMEALFYYRYDDRNLSLKLEENKTMIELLEKFDAEKFEGLLSARKHRCDSFGYEYHYEACIEQIEGTAEFVELNALRQLSLELYGRKLSMMKERIADKNNLVPIRIICYDIGALLLTVLNENGIDFQRGFTDTPFSECLISEAKEYDDSAELVMQEVLDGYYQRADSVIEKALEKNYVVLSKECALLGVNVYNAVFRKNYIISRYFVMYGDEKCSQVEYGDFLIETNGCGRMSKLYRI